MSIFYHFGGQCGWKITILGNKKKPIVSQWVVFDFGFITWNKYTLFDALR